MADEETVETEETPVEETVETEETEETTEETEETSEETHTEDLSEDEIKGAKSLYKLLKDDKSRDNTLRILARQAGILQDPPTTKTEETQARKDLKSTLKEKMGKDWEFFAEQFGPALDDYIKSAVEEVRTEHQNDRQANEVQRVNDEIARTTAKLNKETNGHYAKLESAMSKLAEKILPSASTSTEEYMRMLYNLAAGENKVDPKNLAAKINRNRTDAMSRIQGTHGRGDGLDPNKKLSLKESIQWAAERQGKKGR